MTMVDGGVGCPTYHGSERVTSSDYKTLRFLLATTAGIKLAARHAVARCSAALVAFRGVCHWVSATTEIEDDPETLYYSLPNEIRRVAVIGAGPAGLVFTSTLIKYGFEVRMFERSPNPGGVWHYTERVPIPVSFPNRPIETMAYIPDIPDHLPATRIYEDGDDGLSVDWRISEHWEPSPLWKNMMTTEPHQIMSLPDTSIRKPHYARCHSIGSATEIDGAEGID